MKLKVFAWLLFHDRLNTRNMLKRRHYNIGDDHNCLLCRLNIEETVGHMIFTCSFSKLCWDKLEIHWEPFHGRLQAIEVEKTAILLQYSWRNSLWQPGAFGRRETTKSSDVLPRLSLPRSIDLLLIFASSHIGWGIATRSSLSPLLTICNFLLGLPLC